MPNTSRSSRSAWIEIGRVSGSRTTTRSSRSSRSAWIEMSVLCASISPCAVALLAERVD